MSSRGGGTRTRPRPVRAAGPLVASGATLAAWGAVAHNSGAGWVQALGTVVGAVLLVGLAGPVLALTRTRLAVVSAPLDATAGTTVAAELPASSPVQVRPVDPPGEAALGGPGGGGHPGLPGAGARSPPRRGRGGGRPAWRSSARRGRR